MTDQSMRDEFEAWWDEMNFAQWADALQREVAFQAWQAATRQALERAAWTVEDMRGDTRCADAIRALEG